MLIRYSVQKSIVISLIIILGLLPPHFIAGQDDQSDLISVSVKDVKLEKVLRILSEKSGMKFISDPAVRERRITLDLKAVTAMEALSILTQLYDLGFQQLSKSNKYVVADIGDILVQTQLGFYACEFARASDLAVTIASIVTPGIGKIFADSRTNTIIFQDTPSQIIEIERLVQKLDQPTRQVYIKSAIVEVSITKEHERGIQWFTKDNNVVAGTNFGLKNIPTLISSEPELPSFTAGLGIGILNYDIDVAIHLLSRVNDLNILSTPYLITLDNQSAIIEVGDQIPYPVLNEFGVTSYEFKDATIRLKILPHINNDSTITVLIEPQANFQQGFTPDGIPIIAKRSAKTQVVVKSGQTVVIGGLMRETDVITHTKVPILGSIPLIGELFKSTQIKKQKTELVILLTPKIVDINSPEMNVGENSELSEELREIIE
ncbi:MAG: type II secretion system protein GspD [Candidatus Marinimicrobia bacterium]|nr:type II secretion system protein GspD [Candidatus Neomarinimicrobiota bacterium]